MEAVIEEALRLHSSIIARDTVCDTEILGHKIPKGTTVVMLTNGPGFRSPSYPVDHNKRSAASKASPQKKWDETKDLDAFDPERWLFKNEKDQIVFDPNAGPQLNFGMGPRGCWGRKIAWIQLRLMTVLMIWNFNFLEVPQPMRGREAMDTVLHLATDCYVRVEKRGEMI